jgi:hypothetical protein
MAWHDETIEFLAGRPVCGYQREGIPSVEPTALAALALLTAGRGRQAATALDWLCGVQSTDGSLGIDARTRQPCWPTGWAMLAWNMAAGQMPNAKAKWSAATGRALAWTLATSGRPLRNLRQDDRLIGHDTALQGWPWVVGTHSWVEPTAINLLALRSAGQANHPRAREAVKLLLDRQLPEGGWNYGNTTVLGHVLRPHVQPTGLALAALAGEKGIRSTVQPSLDYLRRVLSDRTATASLCYALLGLSEHDIWPEKADGWLASAWRRTQAGGAVPYPAALLALAEKRAVKRISIRFKEPQHSFNPEPTATALAGQR